MAIFILFFLFFERTKIKKNTTKNKILPERTIQSTIPRTELNRKLALLVVFHFFLFLPSYLFYFAFSCLFSHVLHFDSNNIHTTAQNELINTIQNITTKHKSKNYFIKIKQQQNNRNTHIL